MRGNLRRMNQIALPLLASVLLLSACRSEETATQPTTTTTVPAAPAAKPVAKPVEPSKPVAAPQKPMAETPTPVAETPKPVTETPKPVAETPKPTTDTTKPATEVTKPMPDPTKTPAETQKPPVETPKPATKVDMDAAIKTLMAKPEVPDENIEIQHILISFKGAPRMPASVMRTKEEAKALAEKVYAEIVAGGNFDALVKQHTNDSAPGIYPMTKTGRAAMVKGFGDVGFRLKVGDVGVAPWDATASPFGWHIIKRVK